MGQGQGTQSGSQFGSGDTGNTYQTPTPGWVGSGGTGNIYQAPGGRIGPGRSRGGRRGGGRGRGQFMGGARGRPAPQGGIDWMNNNLSRPGPSPMSQQFGFGLGSNTASGLAGGSPPWATRPAVPHPQLSPYQGLPPGLPPGFGDNFVGMNDVNNALGMRQAGRQRVLGDLGNVNPYPWGGGDFTGDQFVGLDDLNQVLRNEAERNSMMGGSMLDRLGTVIPQPRPMPAIPGGAFRPGGQIPQFGGYTGNTPPGVSPVAHALGPGLGGNTGQPYQRIGPSRREMEGRRSEFLNPLVRRLAPALGDPGALANRFGNLSGAGEGLIF